MERAEPPPIVPPSYGLGYGSSGSEHGGPEPYDPYASSPAPSPVGPEDSTGRTLARRILGPLAGIGIFLAKFAKFALILVKSAKFGGVALSMIVSIAAYSLLWGWQFAAGFVALILVHEMGHVLQLRREGVPASAPLFIPFLGAVIGMRGRPKDAAMEARVGLAGPLLGAVGVGVVGLFAYLLHSQFLQALTYTGAFLNLFNLLPVSPLDGGRAAAALSPRLWFVGLAGLAALVVLELSQGSLNPILVLILIVGGYEVIGRWRRRHADQDAGYYTIARAQRLWIGAVYVGLIALLAVGMDLSRLPRSL